jgi:hypothetical protein
VPEDHLRDYLQRDPVPTGIGSRIPSEIVGSQNNIKVLSQLFDQRPGRKIANRKEAIPRVEVLLLNVVMESFGGINATSNSFPGEPPFLSWGMSGPILDDFES